MARRRAPVAARPAELPDFMPVSARVAWTYLAVVLAVLGASAGGRGVDSTVGTDDARDAAVGAVAGPDPDGRRVAAVAVSRGVPTEVAFFGAETARRLVAEGHSADLTAANNVLARDEHGYALRQLGILYAPDYVVNAGGLINVADELQGYSPERAKAKVEGIFGAVRDILHRAKAEGVPTSEAADRIAKDRMRDISRLRLIRVLPGVGG